MYMEIIGLYWGYIRDSGKGNGNYRDYRVYRDHRVDYRGNFRVIPL